MRSTQTFTEEQRTFIIENASIYTAQEMATKMKLPIHTIRNLENRHAVKFKPERKKWAHERVAVHADQKTPIVRPAAIYDNMPSPYGIASDLTARK